MLNLIEYKPFEDKYYNDIKNITETAFELTSFGTDKEIEKGMDGKIAWEMWCKPVITSNKKKYCITAIYNEKAVGYIIYGANSEYSKIINKKIGNIILLAVDKNFQGNRIAQGLLRYIMDIYNRNKVDIVTVGTDLDNLPALITYLKFNFKPILTWATFRFHNKYKIEIKNKFSVEQTLKIKKNILNKINRPNSLLLDNKIPNIKKIKLINYIKNNAYESIKSKKTNAIIIKKENHNIAVATFIKEKILTAILKKNLFRIIDIIFLTSYNEEKIEITKNIIAYLSKEHKAEIIETFVQLNNWELINILERAGFLLNHNAVTLNAEL